MSDGRVSVGAWGDRREWGARRKVGLSRLGRPCRQGGAGPIHCVRRSLGPGMRSINLSVFITVVAAFWFMYFISCCYLYSSSLRPLYCRCFQGVPYHSAVLGFWLARQCLSLAHKQITIITYRPAANAAVRCQHFKRDEAYEKASDVGHDGGRLVAGNWYSHGATGAHPCTGSYRVGADGGRRGYPVPVPS